MITTYNEVFLLHRKLVKSFSNKSTMYWAIQYVGKAEDRTKFYYKVSMVNKFFIFLVTHSF